jgi:FkbM family methyltransferase
VRSRIPGPIKRTLRPLAALGYRLGLRPVKPSATGSGAKGHAAFTTSQQLENAVKLPEDAPDGIGARNRHGSYWVPRSALHRPAARMILGARVWESDTLDLLRSVDPASDVVHAGTFFGDFIPALACTRRAGALVWAFEPNRESYECALVTIALNQLENVILNHAGLHQESTTMLLATTDAKGRPLGGASHLVGDLTTGVSGEEVNLMAIDEVVSGDRRVGVIQLDVEGHEQAALAGAMHTIERCRPLIVLETPPESWIAEHLEPLGYRIAGAVDANTVLRPS